MVVFGEAAMEFSATVSLVLLSGGATAAAFGRVVGYTFGAALGLVLLTRLLSRSPLFRTGPSPVARRRFMNYAGAMLIVGIASAMCSRRWTSCSSARSSRRARSGSTAPHCD